MMFIIIIGSYLIISALISYLIGSIPFGFIIAKAVKKIDIRQYGSGNIGATNVLRVVGKSWGILVFILDFAKGLIALLLIESCIFDESAWCYIISAIAVICGHNWTCFLRFKGGKGVATSAGAIVGLAIIFAPLWIALTAGLISWIIIFYASKYVSAASLTAGAVFFIVSISIKLPIAIHGFCLLLSALIIFRHVKNIKNLFNKTENRFK